jgi:hypothetical protein
VTLPDEPKGWKKLQERAQGARDPRQLARILDQMNRLLSRHERMSASSAAVSELGPGQDVSAQESRPAA